jgi:CMP-N-acetylneuraminic acid synthetase
MNVALITARRGTPEHPDKNMFPVCGLPLISYPIQAALKARLVDQVYISTDAPDIAAFGRAQGVEIIERPSELTSPAVDYGDVVRHAVEVINSRVTALENVAVMLGNSVMVDSDIIDLGIKLLDEDPKIDSCMTVWRAGHDHPNRALEIGEGGFLRPFGSPSRNVPSDREAYQPAYFSDQGTWIFRKETAQIREGPSPWWWMGARCMPLERPWIRGRDIHTYFDIAIAEWWVRNAPKLGAIFKSDAIGAPGTTLERLEPVLHKTRDDRLDRPFSTP